MKKLLVFLTVLCMICTLSISVFAYNSTSEAWIAGVSYDAASKTITVNLVDGLESTNCSGGWRFAVFSAAPNMSTDQDTGFWNVFKGSEGEDRQGNGTLLGGNASASGASSSATLANDLVSGTYYIGVVGLASDWNWTTSVYEFSYTASEPTDQPSEQPSTSWIESIVSGENGNATITLSDSIPANDTSWTEIAIFTQEQTVDDLFDIYNNKLNRNPGDFALCPAAGNMSANIGPNGPFVREAFVDGQTYYVYIARCILSANWDFQSEPYVFTYEDPAPAPSESSNPSESVNPSETTSPEVTDTTSPENTESTEPENTESTEPENTESTEPENTESTEPENTESTGPENTESTEPGEDTSAGATDDAGDDDDDSTDTADLSVIAYAAAAITGLGALVVGKRK